MNINESVAPRNENSASTHDLLTCIRVLEKQKAELELAVEAAKDALETCRTMAERSNDSVSLRAASCALAVLDIKCANVASVHIEPTYMPADQALNWSWKQLRHDLNDSNWNVGESSTYFAFFLHGWNNRGQYELQRRAPESGTCKLND